MTLKDRISSHQLQFQQALDSKKQAEEQLRLWTTKAQQAALQAEVLKGRLDLLDEMSKETVESAIIDSEIPAPDVDAPVRSSDGSEPTETPQ